MKTSLFTFLLTLCLFNAGAQERQQPKLIVGIVVDQMRYDYLTKFYNDFGEEGFKRLVNGGLNCQNVHYSYKPTYTGPGHATIFTGTSPSVHGIVGNNWFERNAEESVYCVKIKGGDLSGYNPSRMLVETFADGLKQYSNFQSKSFGISLKDRGAILPAGHLADGAYWFNSEKGVWESDRFYTKNNPPWLKEFNDQDFAELYLKEGWRLSKPIVDYAESVPDLNDFEYPLTKEANTTFPHDLLKAQKNSDWGILKKVPQGNQMSADLFKMLIEKESIGLDEYTDFVSLSFSATDYVGHRFGVQSVEVQDTYIKLDQTIADLLQFLDEKVGKENYTLFLTSDHGAAMPRAYLKEKGIPAGELDGREILKKLKGIAVGEGLTEDWIASVMNLNVYFNDRLKSTEEKNYALVKLKCKRWLAQQPGIAKVVDLENTSESQGHREQMVFRGVHSQRSGDLVLIEEANWNSYTDKGSTHGSPYEYDTHVPLIFYGFGVPHGETFILLPVSSIVPNLSLLFGFQTNQVLQAKPIPELFVK